ncbi:hypothetical protein Golob_017569 [Gossypium lobatum]|uniref:DUF4283 domain-containing protein n=1 Tax=Gossypium lobatum TaxID=34289 RepID=A0A7J8M7L0_9ROSI|nr:hypothetical protein [Gossypium lobatum]
MVSWKDKALGRGYSIFGCEEDLEFLEGDITMTTINGVPAINFFEWIQKILVRVMATTMVVKLLGRNLVYSILQNQIFNLWKPSHFFHLMDIENAYFLAKFQSREDYEMILTLFPNTVMAWVHLPGLPGVLYKKLILEEIGNLIGKVANLDFKIDYGLRGRFARMIVFINLDKPLVLYILVNGMMQRVEYESFLAVFFSCGCYGHMQDLCPYNELANADAKVKDANNMNLPVKEKPVELR